MYASLPTKQWQAWEVPPEMREAAATRKGQWILTTVESKPMCRALLPFLQKEVLVSTKIVFKEKEWSTLHQSALQNAASGAKPTVMLGSLQAASNRLWNSGSTEDVTMCELAPHLVQRYVYGGHVVRKPFPRWILWSCVAVTVPPVLKFADRSMRILPMMAAGLALYLDMTETRIFRTSIRRAVENAKTAEVSVPEGKKPLEKEEPDTTLGKPSEGPTADSSQGGDKPGEGKEQDPERAKGSENVNVVAAGKLRVHEEPASIVDVQEADDYLLAEPHKRYRTLEIDSKPVRVVLGQQFEKDRPQTRAPRVGVLVSPCEKIPNVYTNSGDNVAAAVRERWEKKSQPNTFTSEDKRKCGKATQYMLTKVFTDARVHHWFEEHFAGDLVAIKSKKWSEKRMTDTFEALLQKVDPKFQFKTAVKAEAMPEDKAPRFLIADGDYGQVMALAVIKCIEELLFETYEGHSIKHRPKDKAIEDLMEHWTAPKKAQTTGGWSFIEGDGSAWDTTCNEVVRGCFENPIIDKVTKLLATKHLQPESWAEAHLQSCTAKELKLFFSKKGDVWKQVISNIRRSGHRGTSVLNWIVNYCMWMCAMFKDPSILMDPSKRWAEDVAGCRRWMFLACEGDDSAAGTSPKLPQVTDEELAEAARGEIEPAAKAAAAREGVTVGSALCMLQALLFWKRAGFNMKIFCREKVALFVGVELGVDASGMTGKWCPELKRALGNGVACSPALLKAVKDGDMKTVHDIAAATALARAADFAGRVPTLSRKYLEYADSLSTREFKDDEMSYRACGETGMTTNAVRDMVETRNARCSPDDQAELLAALGLTATDDELAKFESYAWDIDCVDQHDAFRDALPSAWRA